MSVHGEAPNEIPIVQCVSQGGSNPPEANDRFGRALAVGDFDCDGCDDLVIGSPYENWSSVADTGYLSIAYGSALGAGAGTLEGISPQVFGLHQDSSAKLGFAITTGDFDGDGFDDLAIGAPGADFNTTSNAGAVYIMEGSSFGASYNGSVFGDMARTFPEANDALGFSLSAGFVNNDGLEDLAIGAPGEGRSGSHESGILHILYGQTSGLTTSGMTTRWPSEVGSVEKSGSRFGESVAVGAFSSLGGVAVGVPGSESFAFVDSGEICIYTHQDAVQPYCRSGE